MVDSDGGGGETFTIVELKIFALIGIFLFRLTVIIWLFAIAAFDPLFYTYQAYLLFTGAMAYLLISWTNRALFRFFVMFIFPVVFGVVLFIGIAIIVMVFLNDEIFLTRTVFRGGTRTIAVAHSGDWLLHQLPVIEVIIVTVCITRYARIAMRNVRAAWRGTFGYWLYLFFFFTASVWPLVLYVALFPFQQNYPMSLSITVCVVLMIVISIAIGVLLWLIWMLPNQHEEAEIELRRVRKQLEEEEAEMERKHTR